jgi:hypothetical protein
MRKGLQQQRATGGILAAALVLIASVSQPYAETAESHASAAPPALVGTWRGDLRDLLGTFAFTLRLDQDGTYATQHVLLGGYTIRMRGRWTAEFPLVFHAPAGSSGVISFEAIQSEPEEFCSAGTQSNPVTIRDPNTIEFGDGSADYPSGLLRRIE